MSDWIAIELWSECVRMEKPESSSRCETKRGAVSLTRCVRPLSKIPFDWQIAARPLPSC